LGGFHLALVALCHLLLHSFGMARLFCLGRSSGSGRAGNLGATADKQNQAKQYQGSMHEIETADEHVRRAGKTRPRVET